MTASAPKADVCKIRHKSNCSNGIVIHHFGIDLNRKSHDWCWQHKLECVETWQSKPKNTTTSMRLRCILRFPWTGTVTWAEISCRQNQQTLNNSTGLLSVLLFATPSLNPAVTSKTQTWCCLISSYSEHATTGFAKTFNISNLVVITDFCNYRLEMWMASEQQ